MARRGKPKKAKAEAKPRTRTPSKEDTKVRDLEGRLAEALRLKTEALEQQAATAEILRLINASPADSAPVFEAILRSALRLARADYGAALVREGELLHAATTLGLTWQWHDVARRVYPLRIDAETPSGQAVMEGRPVFIDDAQNSPLERVRSLARTMGYRCQLMVPMTREGSAVGVLGLVWQEARELAPEELSLLQAFADQAAIAIENARLFTELEVRNKALTESLDRQTATADVLRIIAQSPTDLGPVLDAIATSAVRLCAASDAVIERLEGAHFYNAAHAGTQMKGRVGLPLPLTRGFPGGRAILDRQPVILDDIHLV